MANLNYNNLEENGIDPFSIYLLDHFVPITLFINKDLDILYTNGNLEDILKLPQAISRMNVTKMLSEETGMIFRDGVFRALDTNETISYQQIPFKKNKNTLFAQVNFQRIVLEDGQEPIALVTILPINANEKLSANTEQKLSTDDFLDHRITRLENELTEKDKKMQGLVSNLEITNEELEASNEELLESNEELQSTNEELQSVNEELHTVNTELQLKNEEVTTTYNDLDNLFRSTNIGAIFLDADLQIRRFTPAIRHHFDLVESDIDRPITTFAHHLKAINLLEVCRQVFRELLVFEREIKDEKGHPFLLRILPYRTEHDKIKGVVLTFIEIDELYKAKLKIGRLAENFKAIFNYSDATLILYQPEGNITKVNKGFGDFSLAQLEGQNLFDLLPPPANNVLKRATQQVVKQQESTVISVSLNKKGDGLAYHFKITVIPIPNDEEQVIKRLALVILDISKDVYAVENLKKAKKKYVSFMENATHQIALVDQKGIIQEINYTRYSGKEKQELIGTSIYDQLSKSEVGPYRASLESIFQGASKSEISFKYVNKDGKTMDVTLLATPVIIDKKIEYVALIGNPV
ncbi:MAG: PAS domain-containing protein [Bacteroidota bacterium]